MKPSSSEAVRQARSPPGNWPAAPLDPRPAVGVFDLPGVLASGTWTLKPNPGMMLMFPSWLRHAVLPYYGESTRITIAFNLRVGELTSDGR